MTVIIVGQDSHEMGDQALKSMKIIRFYDHGNKTTPSLHKTKKMELLWNRIPLEWGPNSNSKELRNKQFLMTLKRSLL